jgi:hypothetical protein
MAQQLRSAPLEIKTPPECSLEKVISSQSINRQQHSLRPITLLNRGRCRFIFET